MTKYERDELRTHCERGELLSTVEARSLLDTLDWFEDELNRVCEACCEVVPEMREHDPDDDHDTEHFVRAALRKLLDPESGVGEIAAERRRHLCEEGWTPDHDDKHTEQELAWAATHYAAPSPVHQLRFLVDDDDVCRNYLWRNIWPWELEWDKRRKHDRIKQLRVAGSLIAAEIDRLKRAAADKAVGAAMEEES